MKRERFSVSPMSGGNASFPVVSSIRLDLKFTKKIARQWQWRIGVSVFECKRVGSCG